MNVVDSSAWLEYFADGPNADYFAPAIEDAGNLIVPTVCIYEVFKRVLQQRDEDAALQAMAQMRTGTVVSLDDALAIQAAHLSHVLKIAMADSMVLATARHLRATVWTQDDDFKDLPDVCYRAKVKPSTR